MNPNDMPLFMANYRRNDPPTSREAATIAESSGSLNVQRRQCLDTVKSHPGLTSAEIAREAGLERHQAARRLPELRTAGLLRNGEIRRCRVCGKQSLTWWLNEK